MGYKYPQGYDSQSKAYIKRNTMSFGYQNITDRILNPVTRAYVEKLFPKVLEMMPKCKIVKPNVKKHYLHLVMYGGPICQNNNLIKLRSPHRVGRLKRITGSRLRKKFSRLKKVY
jgi:hypothetical protein